MSGESTTLGYRHLSRQPGVRGGHVIIEGTRIGVHDVIGLLQNEETIDSLIANCFSNVTRAQIYESLAFYEDNRGEMDLLVTRQMSVPRCVKLINRSGRHANLD